jgi:hypothetical protein
MVEVLAARTLLIQAIEVFCGELLCLTGAINLSKAEAPIDVDI